MRKLTMICLSGILLSMAVAGYTYPTLWGPTGGAVLPTAEIASEGRLDVAADFYDSEFNSTVPVRAVWGQSNWEIGGLYAFNDENNAWGANAKIGIPLGGRQGLALGAIYTALTDSDINSTYVYLAYTYKFNQACPENGMMTEPGLSGTIGVNWTDVQFDNFFECVDNVLTEVDGGSDNAFRAYINADYTFPNFLTIGGEIQSKSSDIGETDPLGAVYLRYPFSDMISAQIGMTNSFPGVLVGTGDYNFFAGANFSFGPGARRAARKGECECPSQTEQCPVEPEQCPPSSQQQY